MRRYSWGIGLAGFMTFVLSGCGGSGFSEEIRVPAEQRHVLTAGSPTGDQIRLPGDRTFNIHLATSDRDAGPIGSASGDSAASPDGNAFCEAKGANGGTASADFVLGHRIDNETSNRLTAAVQVEFDLAQEARGPMKPAPKTSATGNLTVQILDSHRRPVAAVPVVQTTSDSAVGSSMNKYRFNLSALFEAQQSYSMILQGNVKSETDAGQEASARLAVQNLRMRVTFSPAPPESAPASAPASSRPAGT